MTTPKPLAGIRIVDLTRVLAGPWATQLLADLGAEVLKIERPMRGDESRSFGPPFLGRQDGRRTTASAMFLAANRGKRSVTLNIAQAEGRDILLSLIETADVLVENFKVGALERLGLTPAILRERNPKLIICSITGYGQTGPYSERGGYDPVIQGLCGLMSVTGHPLSEAGGGPVKTGPSLIDILTGLYAVVAIEAALIGRRNDEPGVDIDLSLLDTGVASCAQQAMQAALTTRAPAPIGNSSNGGVPGGGYLCADGFIMIAPGNDEGYARMCYAIGREDLASDERFVTNASRLAHRGALLDILEPLFRRWRVADLVDALVAADVPAGPVNDMLQVERDPQILHRGLYRSLPDRFGEGIPQVASPIVIGGHRLCSATPPPELGDSTKIILEQLGIDAGAVEDLQRRQIV
jgi:crotonobetainyl-CoA:carnitine CoA-transferase CaiB-like acyl-CoA transferase